MGWVSIVDKEYPKVKFQEVLVLDVDDGYEGGFEIRVGMWWNDELVKAETLIGFNNPTHWMPLPKPPL